MLLPLLLSTAGAVETSDFHTLYPVLWVFSAGTNLGCSQSDSQWGGACTPRYARTSSEHNCFVNYKLFDLIRHDWCFCWLRHFLCAGISFRPGFGLTFFIVAHVYRDVARHSKLLVSVGAESLLSEHQK